MSWNVIGAASLCAVLALGSACSLEQDSDGHRAPNAAQGRDETQAIRNMENIGVSGNAIADKLDSAIDSSERRDDDLEEELDQYH